MKIGMVQALVQHLKQATYQGRHIWGQVLKKQQVIPEAVDWGWSKAEDGKFLPVWSLLPDMWKSTKELISCKCKKGCKRNCKCEKNSVPCCGLCECDGICGDV